MTTDDDTDDLDEFDPDYSSQEEYDLCNELDNEAKERKLNGVVEKYRLRDYLDDDEMQVLRDLWLATDVAEFMIDALSFMSLKLDNPRGKLHEEATRQAEEYLVDTKEKMMECPGWMLLDPAVQQAVCDELFTIKFPGDDYG